MIKKKKFESLQKSIRSIDSFIRAFDFFRQGNARLSVLLENVGFILNKHNLDCVNSCQCSPDDDSIDVELKKIQSALNEIRVHVSAFEANPGECEIYEVLLTILSYILDDTREPYGAATATSTSSTSNSDSFPSGFAGPSKNESKGSPSRKRKIETRSSCCKKSKIQIDRHENTELKFNVLKQFFDSLTKKVNGMDSTVLAGNVGLKSLVVDLHKMMDETNAKLTATKEPIPPETQALTNNVILTEVFPYMDTKDLINFRLVNRKWNELATSLLLKRNSTEIILITQPPYGDDNANEAPPKFCSIAKESLALEDLNNIIENSSVFPSRSLMVRWGNLQSDPEMVKFFSLYGSHLKEMILDDRVKVSRNFLQYKILALTPNLEFLCLSFLKMSADLGNQSFNFTLPHLKKLRINLDPNINANRSLIKELFKAAHNLEEVEILNCVSLLDLISQENKAHLIKNFVFSPRRPRVPYVKRFADLKPQLKKFRIRLKAFCSHESSRQLIAETLTLILQSSRESLELLGIHPLETIPGIKLPSEFRNLKHLRIDAEPEHSKFAVFPSVYDFSKLFPNLLKVTLKLDGYSKEELRVYFPQHFCETSPTPFTRVKYLEIVNLMRRMDSGMEVIATLFPAVKHIRIHCDYAGVLSSFLWCLPSVTESIELHGFKPQMTFNDEGIASALDYSPSIDSCFTGIPAEICEKLAKIKSESNQVLSTEIITCLRNEPCICDMKYLKKLKIFFEDGLEAPFASQVSYFYGFKWVPQLKVTFAHDPEESNRYNWRYTKTEDFQKFLEPLLPYINISQDRKVRMYSPRL